MFSWQAPFTGKRSPSIPVLFSNPLETFISSIVAMFSIGKYSFILTGIGVDIESWAVFSIPRLDSFSEILLITDIVAP